MLKRFARLSRAAQLIAGVAVLVFLVFGMSGGCNAYERPPELTAAERALVQTGPLPYSVTVAWWDEQTKTNQNPQAYADALASIVGASKIFKTFRYEQSSAPSGQDLVATSTGLYCNSAVIPLFTIISLGVIPTTFQDRHCEGMLLRRAAGQPKDSGVKVEVRFRGAVIMGWAAVLAGARPGWAYGSLANDARFVDLFRLAVIQKRIEIDRLVARSSVPG